MTLKAISDVKPERVLASEPASERANGSASGDGGERGRGDAAERVRADIVARSFDLFSHYGYNKTNIGDIAAGCGMSPGNLYRYFRNKQAIGHAVVDACLREEAELTAALLAEPLDARAADPHAARLRAYVTLLVMRTVGFSSTVAADSRACGDDRRDAGRARGRLAALERRSRELTRILEEGARAGAFRVSDVAETALAVDFATRFFHTPASLLRHGLGRIEQDLAATLDLICAGLRAGSVADA